MKPDFRKVSCYRLSKGQEKAFVWINRAEISSCERDFQGGDHYFARLVMKHGEAYFISEDDYFRIFPDDFPVIELREPITQGP